MNVLQAVQDLLETLPQGHKDWNRLQEMLDLPYMLTFEDAEPVQHLRKQNQSHFQPVGGDTL